MIVFLVVSLVVLVGLVVALVLGHGRLSVPMTPAVRSAGGNPLPVDRQVSAVDLAEVRFDRAVRGYRMDQVDDVVDRLRAELAERDAELRDLRDRSRLGSQEARGQDPDDIR